MQSNSAYFVGADIGTTGCRASIYDTVGTLFSSASAEYALQVPQAGWAEQDPQVIFQAFCQTLKQALDGFPHDRKLIKALTFSTVFHSIFPVSKEGEPLHPMLIFADTRAQP